MDQKIVPLATDTADHEAIRRWTFKNTRMGAEVAVARDRYEPLDYLSGTGLCVGRELPIMAMITLQKLNLPNIDGLEVLRLPSDERTNLLPIVIEAAPIESRYPINDCQIGVYRDIHKPVECGPTAATLRRLGLCWLPSVESPSVKRAS